jgi:hypothetical protein
MNMRYQSVPSGLNRLATDSNGQAQWLTGHKHWPLHGTLRQG